MQSKVAEEDLYDPVRQCLREKFRQKFGNCYLEITSPRFGEKIKSVLETDVLLYLSKERLRPDLTGYVRKNGFNRIMVVEIKKNPLKVSDIYQVKMYAELFEAEYALLISPEPIQEEVKRLANRYPLCSYSAGYKLIIIGQFDMDQSKILEDTWFPYPLFEFE